MSSLDDEHLTHHSPAAYGMHAYVPALIWTQSYPEVRDLQKDTLVAGLHRKYPITMGREVTWHEHPFKRVKNGQMVVYGGEEFEDFDEISCSAEEATHFLIMAEVIVPAWVEIELAVPRAVYP